MFSFPSLFRAALCILVFFAPSARCPAQEAGTNGDFAGIVLQRGFLRLTILNERVTGTLHVGKKRYQLSGQASPVAATALIPTPQSDTVSITYFGNLAALGIHVATVRIKDVVTDVELERLLTLPAASYALIE